ncbi:TetR/AcrR family transcriptional regulator [Solihabitans fulvus]|uniref:TetR/AcrR family transcriptional regulator n=1 Tax=Solihabitans fulvus TaxID=1892852 RepID=A0A5B2XS21_9PSEU|nr:TetR/AcrR family transcriptional regulator [Solihabitans fulvus]KAA2265760.1 TetR/AcrR family transcriptional regulator [Solihabitans fulvus]
MTAPSIRARVRAELTEEIKAVARRHLAADGANLSLRAVARDLGMVPSALYRYFPSRDALLTALITSAYDDMGAAVEAAEAAVPRADPRGRWLAVCGAARTWALEHPAEYALIYGSPVPGYAAPQDTVGPASRVIVAVVAVLFDGAAAGHLAQGPATPMPPALLADLRELMGKWPGPEPLPREWAAVPAEAVLAVAMTLWTQLFGLISFEVFGRLEAMLAARQEYFDHQVEVMADFAGLAPTDR